MINGNLLIRPSTEEDRAFFVRVHNESYRDTIEKMFGWDETLQCKNANKAFDEGGINIIYKDGHMVGVVGWLEQPEFLWFKEFFILPEYQGGGLGSNVLEKVKLLSRDINKPIRLRTLKGNLKVKKLYERQGFILDEITDIHMKFIGDFRS